MVSVRASDVVDAQTRALMMMVVYLAVVKHNNHRRLETKVPVLLEIVLPFEAFAAHVAGVGDVVAMAALVNHQVVGLNNFNYIDTRRTLSVCFALKRKKK